MTTTGLFVLAGLVLLGILLLILLSGVRAIQESRVDVVPRVLVGGDKENGSGNIMEALLTMLLSDRFSALTNKGQSQRSQEAEKLRTEIKKSMTDKKE